MFDILWLIIILLVIFWLLGIIAFPAVHLLWALLIIAIVLVLFKLFANRTGPLL